MNTPIRTLILTKGFHARKQHVKFLWNALITKYWYGHFFKSCGRSNVIMPTFYISPENMILHNNIIIFDGARIEAVRSYEGFIFDPLLILNDYVHIQQNLHLTFASKIEIGKNTSIAANVTITDIEHPYEDVTLPIERQPIKSNPVYIGEDCNISNNSVILPGTYIGKHCTVGANSVVKGVFPDFCVIVGAPAKIVKRYSLEKKSWLKTDHCGNFLISDM